jgi:hypothetical protein
MGRRWPIREARVLSVSWNSPVPTLKQSDAQSGQEVTFLFIVAATLIQTLAFS